MGAQATATCRNPKAHEAEPIQGRTGVRLASLSKKFKALDAVKDVTLNMFEDHITVLLGHNGASPPHIVTSLPFASILGVLLL